MKFLTLSEALNPIDATILKYRFLFLNYVRAFSIIKLIKTSLRNKMEHEFLANSMVIYVEREIADAIDPDFIIDKFDILNNRKIQLK
ncbi:hypothetical protein ACOSQ3_007172 [Xanthoceras sorbifolium]